MLVGCCPVTATRYVTPLREGGSLPGLMEADDLGTYVVKWRGAGQGRKVLVAEVVCWRAGPRAGPAGARPGRSSTSTPELAAGEPDVEVQELLQRSPGSTSAGLPARRARLRGRGRRRRPGLAGRVLWFDALIGNVDRSWRNPNMLFWHGRLQLIDHGAALIFHHHWPGAPASATRPYDAGDARAGREREPDVAPPTPRWRRW